MAGPDGSGDTPRKPSVLPPPGTSRKRKRGADAGIPVRMTRSSSSTEARQAVDEAAVVAGAGLSRRVTRRSASSHHAVDESAVAGAGQPRRVTRGSASSPQAVDEAAVVDPGLPRRVTRGSPSSRQAVHEAAVADGGLPRRVARGSASSRKEEHEAAVADVGLSRRVTRSSPSSRQVVDEPAVADAGLSTRVTRSLPSSRQVVDEPAVADASLPRRVTRSSASSPQAVDEAAVAEAGLPRRVTRSAASSRQAVDAAAVADAVRLARSVAVGTRLMGLGRGVVDVEVERMREVVLEARQALFVRLEPDDPDSPYAKKRKILRSGSRRSQRVACQITYLSRFRNKHIGTDPVEHLASVPEWKNAASEEDTADYKSETFLQKLGTIVHPFNTNISSTDEPEKMRVEMVDKCNCSFPGSADCVQVHVEKARSWIKDQLGEEAFIDCGLDAMGGQVLELWSAEDKSKLDDIDKLIPHNQHQRFMKIASEQLSQSKAKDLAKYYYNVFLPRRLASLTRAEPKEDEDVDTKDEASGEDDENTEYHSGKKNKGLTILPKRGRK